MFNLKHFKLVKELKDIKLQLNWVSFSKYKSNAKKELFNSIINDNKFIEEDLKIRSMVEEMLVKEFSNDIKNIKSYDFLVDSVVNKLKQKQIEEISPLQEIE